MAARGEHVSTQTGNTRKLLAWNREALMWIAFYGLILLAWAGIFAMTRGAASANLGAMPAEFWASLCIAAEQANFPALVVMWTLMSGAMMLPTFVPALRTFRDISTTGASDLSGAFALVAGYGSVWLGASVLGAGAQMALSGAGVLSPFGASISDFLTAFLLLGAGAYQFSKLKEACLAKCRMPLVFFMEHWKPGNTHAWGMGLKLGVLCFGCCWALMALGFVGGTMNLLWMGAATLFMVMEKLPDIGRWLTRPAGFAMILAGGAVLLRALLTL
jgi:predicted metal-binding membrane protein